MLIRVIRPLYEGVFFRTSFPSLSFLYLVDAKCICDGAVASAMGQAACGGVLRDHNGKLIFAYASHLGNCSVVAAELWDILKGVTFAWDRGFRRIFVDSDSLSAINLLKGCVDLLTKKKKKKGCVDLSHPCASIIQQIRGFMQQGGT